MIQSSLTITGPFGFSTRSSAGVGTWTKYLPCIMSRKSRNKGGIHSTTALNMGKDPSMGNWKRSIGWFGRRSMRLSNQVLWTDRGACNMYLAVIHLVLHISSGFILRRITNIPVKVYLAPTDSCGDILTQNLHSSASFLAHSIIVRGSTRDVTCRQSLSPHRHLPSRS